MNEEMDEEIKKYIAESEAYRNQLNKDIREVISKYAALLPMDTLMEVFKKNAKTPIYRELAKQAFKDYIDNKFE